MSKIPTLFIIISLFLINNLLSKDLEKISLQLQWLDQFQFAGYYIAKEKGFYKDIGLDVELKKFNYGINVVDEVVQHKATYGIGRSSLIIDKSKGKDIQLLSAIFQSSPLVILSINPSIKNIRSFIDKQIMITPDIEQTVALQAMMNQYNISKNNLIMQKHSFNINDLINKNTDLMVSYISNEPFLLQTKGIKYNIFDPKDYGYDFYSDILFTSSYEIQYHQQRAIDFRDSTIKGWKYAFANIDETVDLILKKYNTQNKTKKALLYEANELKKLAYYKTTKLALIDKYKIQRIYDIYNVMGFVKKNIDIEKFVLYEDKQYSINLNKKQIKYLKTKKELTVCVKNNWLPYEGLDNDKFIGISADLLNLYSKKLSIPLKIIPAKNQVEIRKLLLAGRCDIKPIIGINVKIKIPYKHTNTYATDTIALTTRIEQPFIQNLNNLDKTIVIIKEFNRFKKFIKKEYPKLKIKEVKDLNTALELVASQQAFGYIGTSFTSSYYIQKRFSTKLKIVNDFKNFEFGFGVLNSELPLVDILNQAIKSTTKLEKQLIFNKWLATTIEKEQDYTLIWQIIGIFIFILLIILFFLIKQNKLKNEIESLNHNLENKIDLAVLDLHRAQKLAKVGSWRFHIYDDILTWSDEIYSIFELDKKIDNITKIEDFIKYIHTDDLKLLTTAYDRHIAKRESFRLIHRIITKNLKIKYVEMRCETTFNKNGIAMVSNGTIQDITEQKLIEENIKTKDEQMLQQSRLAQMGEMISMIAHQWRQPLNAISLTSNNLQFKLLMDNLDKELFKKEIALIDDYSQHLSKTIDDFRGFFKENKKQETTTLEKIVNSTLNIVKRSVENKNITIVTNFNCNEEFKTYSNEIKQVVLNLIKNAEDILLDNHIKKPIIFIETLCTNNEKQLIIKDNAGGIPKNIIDKIFEPYFSTKKEKDGTGLGLYMSKTIIEKHCGGKLSVLNDHEGAVFTIEFKTEYNGENI